MIPEGNPFLWRPPALRSGRPAPSGTPAGRKKGKAAVAAPRRRGRPAARGGERLAKQALAKAAKVQEQWAADAAGHGPGGDDGPRDPPPGGGVPGEALSTEHGAAAGPEEPGLRAEEAGPARGGAASAGGAAAGAAEPMLRPAEGAAACGAGGRVRIAGEPRKEWVAEVGSGKSYVHMPTIESLGDGRVMVAWQTAGRAEAEDDQHMVYTVGGPGAGGGRRWSTPKRPGPAPGHPVEPGALPGRRERRRPRPPLLL